MTKKRGISSVMVLTLSLLVTLILAATSVTATQGCTEGDQGFYRVTIGPFGYHREFVCEDEGTTMESQFGFKPFNIFDRYERRARIFSYYRISDAARYAEQIPYGVPPQRMHPSSQFHSLFDEAIRRFFGVPLERRHPSDQRSLIYGPREVSYLHQYLRFTPPDKVRIDQFPYYHFPEVMIQEQKRMAEGRLPPEYYGLEYIPEYTDVVERVPEKQAFRKGPIDYTGYPSTMYAGVSLPGYFDYMPMERYETVWHQPGVY